MHVLDYRHVVSLTSALHMPLGRISRQNVGLFGPVKLGKCGQNVQVNFSCHTFLDVTPKIDTLLMGCQSADWEISLDVKKIQR